MKVPCDILIRRILKQLAGFVLNILQFAFDFLQLVFNAYILRRLVSLGYGHKVVFLNVTILETHEGRGKFSQLHELLLLGAELLRDLTILSTHFVKEIFILLFESGNFITGAPWGDFEHLLQKFFVALGQVTRRLEHN